MIDLQEISNNYGIYMLICLVNCKIYIGKSNNLKKRINEHKTEKDNSPIHNAIRKYGWKNFTVLILQDYKDKVDKWELCALETAFIEYFNSIDKNIGYNILLFGFDRTGTVHSQETKDKMSKNACRFWKGKHLSQETKLKLSKDRIGEKNWNYGKHLSQETKRKLSQPKDKKIYQFKNLLTNEIFNGTQHGLYKKYNLRPSGVNNVIKGLYKSTEKWVLIN